MDNIKYRLESFQLYDFSGMEAHLQKMARKGWALDKVGALFWKYRRTEPQNLRFSVTYYPEASSYNPGPTESQEMLYEFCEEAGWTFVGEWLHMQIFSRPAGDANVIPLETDPQVKLENIQRTMKKSGGAGNIFTLLTIPLWLLFMFLNKSTMEKLTDSYLLFALIEYVLIALFAMGNLACYGWWYRKAKSAAEKGEELPPMNGHYRTMGWVILILIAVFALFWMKYLAKRMYLIIVAVMLPGIFISVFVAERVRLGMKKRQATRKQNMAATTTTIVVMSLAAMVCITSVMIMGITRDWFREGSRPAEYTTYAQNGSSWTWDVYHDEIPLKVEDFMEVDYEHYSKERISDAETLFAHRVRFCQNGFPDGEEHAELDYEIMDTKLYYQECVEDMLRTETQIGDAVLMDREFKTEGTEELRELLQADEVYQLHRDDGPRPLYVIAWTRESAGKDRIAKIEFSWEPTLKELQMAGETLLKAQL